MEITIRMEQAIDFRDAADSFRNKKLPLPGAYKLNKILHNLEKDFEFYLTRFQEIIEKYAKKDEQGNYEFTEDGTQILIQDGKVDECNKELEELFNLEITIDNLNLTIDNLGENLECTPDELDKLMPFFG